MFLAKCNCHDTASYAGLSVETALCTAFCASRRLVLHLACTQMLVWIRLTLRQLPSALSIVPPAFLIHGTVVRHMQKLCENGQKKFKKELECDANALKQQQLVIKCSHETIQERNYNKNKRILSKKAT